MVSNFFNPDALAGQKDPERKEREVELCGNCKSSRFQYVQAVQIAKDFMAIPGQKPPQAGPGLELLRCLRCGELNVPNMVSMGGDPVRSKQVNDLLDEVNNLKAEDTKSSESEVSELATLRKEVTELKKQLAELKGDSEGTEKQEDEAKASE